MRRWRVQKLAALFGFLRGQQLLSVRAFCLSIGSQRRCGRVPIQSWVFLYGVGGLFALLGCLVSVHAPRTPQVKGLSLALFGLFFYFSFLITAEQG